MGQPLRALALLVGVAGLAVPAMAPAQTDLSRACPRCTAYYCPANPDTQELLEKKRQLAREQDYPPRILNLLNQVNPVCPACLENAPTFPMVYVYPPEPGELPQVWSPDVERNTRLRFRAGRIKGYYIRWIGPCKCCAQGKRQKPFDASGKAKDGIGLRDGLLRYESEADLRAVTDLGGKKRPIPQERTFADPKPPRHAEALCRACESAAAALNNAEQAHYQALRADVDRKRRLERVKVRQAELHNAMVDLYRREDAGKISSDTFTDEKLRLDREIARLDNQWISLHAGPAYKRIHDSIRKTRKAVDEALAKTQDCQTRLCKPDAAQTAKSAPQGGDAMSGAPPARWGLKPKLICGRFPPRYREPCYREVRKYYAAAEAHQAGKSAAPASRATCVKGCEYVHANWTLSDWARRTALQVIVETRAAALATADDDKRRVEIRSWFEQAQAFWSETNSAINSCTKAEALKRNGNCLSGCGIGKARSGPLYCAIQPLMAVSHPQWISNLYPPGSQQRIGLRPEDAAARENRRRILEVLRSQESAQSAPREPQLNIRPPGR